MLSMETITSPTGMTVRGSRHERWRRPVAGLVTVAVLLALVVAATPLHERMATSTDATAFSQFGQPCSETCPFGQLHDALAADGAVLRVPLLPLALLLALFVVMAAVVRPRRGEVLAIGFPATRLHILLRTFRC